MLLGKIGNIMLEFLENSYSGKRVFVTGHTGFKGSWMIKTLSLLGATVKGYALNPQNDNDLFNLINGNTISHSIIADIRDKERVSEEILAFQPDYLFHLAAQPLVRQSYEIPNETFEVNVIGTANVLDAIRKLDKSCSIVVITTDKVYQNNEWVYPYREDDKLGGHDPYSASKACAELLVESYRRSFFSTNNSTSSFIKGIGVARAGNVIGGGDWAKDRLLPDIIRSFGSKSKVVIRNPDAVRPWQHVLEPVIGYLIFGIFLKSDPNKYGKAYNFGPPSSDTFSVKGMLDLAIAHLGYGEYNIIPDKDFHEAKLLKLDVSKANDELNWFPKLDSAKAVEITIEWYKTYYDSIEIINDFTRKQIIDYITTDGK